MGKDRLAFQCVSTASMPCASVRLLLRNCQGSGITGRGLAILVLNPHCFPLAQVPMDQPKRMLSLFGDFVHGRLFEHTPQAKPQGGKVSWKRDAATQ